MTKATEAAAFRVGRHAEHNCWRNSPEFSLSLGEAVYDLLRRHRVALCIAEDEKVCEPLATQRRSVTIGCTGSATQRNKSRRGPIICDPAPTADPAADQAPLAGLLPRPGDYPRHSLSESISDIVPHCLRYPADHRVPATRAFLETAAGFGNAHVDRGSTDRLLCAADLLGDGDARQRDRPLVVEAFRPSVGLPAPEDGVDLLWRDHGVSGIMFRGDTPCEATMY